LVNNRFVSSHFNAMALGKKNAFFGQDKALIGIDIGSSAVKLVQLSRVGKSYQISAYATAPIDKGGVVNGVIDKPALVVNAIERCLNRSGVTVKNVAIALPGSFVSSRVLTFPQGFSDQTMYEQIEAEASIHIPFSIEDARFDFSKIGLNTNKIDIDALLVFAKREVVDARVNAIEAAGIAPKIVDLEPYCVQRCIGQAALSLPKKGKGLVLAHFELGAVSATLTVVREHEILFQRTQPFGGQQLTQIISKQYSLSVEEAEIKKRNNDLPDDYTSKVLKPFLRDAAQLLDRSLELFYTSTAHSRVDQLFLAGGCAVLPGLADTLIHTSQVPVVLFAPQASFTTHSRVNARQLSKDAASLTVAFGLAMRAFD
jgi:type IV pilus assembly protein PilM